MRQVHVTLTDHHRGIYRYVAVDATAFTLAALENAAGCKVWLTEGRQLRRRSPQRVSIGCAAQRGLRCEPLNLDLAPGRSARREGVYRDGSLPTGSMDFLIESIEHVTDHDSCYDGFEIKVGDADFVRVMIDNISTCCERWGVRAECPGSLELADLVGASIRDIRWGPDPKVDEEDFEGTHEAPVEIQTTAGLLRLVPWNTHNGYYPHTVLLEWPGNRDEQSI